jgi:hypothetical protein
MPSRPRIEVGYSILTIGVSDATEPDAAYLRDPGLPARGLCVMGWRVWPHLAGLIKAK